MSLTYRPTGPDASFCCQPSARRDVGELFSTLKLSLATERLSRGCRRLDAGGVRGGRGDVPARASAPETRGRHATRPSSERVVSVDDRQGGIRSHFSPAPKVGAGCRCAFEADVRRGDASRQWRVDERRARMVQRRTGGRGNGHTRGARGCSRLFRKPAVGFRSFARNPRPNSVPRPFARLAGRPKGWLVLSFTGLFKVGWSSQFPLLSSM